MKYLFAIVFLFLISDVFAQQLKKGLIMPNSSGKFISNSVHIPTTGLKVYNKYGELEGQILRGSSSSEPESYRLYFKKNDQLTKIDSPRLYMVSYEVLALEYSDVVAGFVQIENDYWIEIEELEANGLTIVNWMQYALKENRTWYAKEPGLNLRTEPSIDTNILLTLKGDLFEIKPTQETNGLWCKVEVTEYRAHPASGGSNLVIRTITGWVKLISDDQTLNVLQNVVGC